MDPPPDSAISRGDQIAGELAIPISCDISIAPRHTTGSIHTRSSEASARRIVQDDILEIADLGDLPVLVRSTMVPAAGLVVLAKGRMDSVLVDYVCSVRAGSSPQVDDGACTRGREHVHARLYGHGRVCWA